MKDPVMLPSTKAIVDRKTIGSFKFYFLETHLLTNQTDPYNRSELTKEMLVPLPDLKEEIKKFLIEKKTKKKKI